MAGKLHVVGVRHHSPACAGLVRRVIERVRPAFVLIEGPSDFNPHIGDLRLPHEPPVAIFSFFASEGVRRASYTPFCAYSPEWQALQSAWEFGATPLFCDLPAWDEAFGDRLNRYADPHSERVKAAEAALCHALGEDGHDALWDALAEQAEPDKLAETLDRYFDLLRPEGAEDFREAARELCMGRYAAWALKEAAGESVVLVCGGWHAEAVRRIAASADGVRPEAPEVPEGARAGSYVVPYDYGRLDRFTGYAAGMPSPAYYDRVADIGLAAAADWASNEIAKTMRAAGQVVSTADRIGWQAHAQGLAAARGHRATLRSDLLDAALATLVKDGLEAPADWTQAGAVRRGSHPAVVAMLKALSGTRRGKLAPGTRQPPLVADVKTRLAELDLTPTRDARRVDLDWNGEADRRKAHVLHALDLIGLPGIERLEGPADAETRAPKEAFRIVFHRDALGALIEASRWGGALPMAAGSVLADRLAREGQKLSVVAATLSDALFAGLVGTDTELIDRLRNGVSASHNVKAIGLAGRHAVRLYRFGGVFGAVAQDGLGRVATTLFHRAMWLVEGIENAEEGVKAIDAMLCCRDLARDCPELGLDRAAYLATLSRLVAKPEAPPALGGAALGARIACGEDAAEGAERRIRRFAQPDQLGDFLGGLFALAREELAENSGVTSAVDALVEGWSDDEFLTALPAMRMAFSWFPPRERERFARGLLKARGLGDAEAGMQALAWMRQRSQVSNQAAALALEARVAARLERAGLH